MASILDSAILLGKEDTYGTAATTLTHAYEGKADSFKRAQEYLGGSGIRGGQHTERANRRKAINMGGEGSLEFDVLTEGFGFVLQAMLGTVTGPTLNDLATSAYTTTAVTTTDDPNDSYTVQVQRVDISGAAHSFSHYGSVISGWNLTQDVGGLLVATLNFDFQDVDRVMAAGTPSYPDNAMPFDWTEAVVSIDGTTTDVISFNLEADLALKTDRRFLRGSALKKRPIRSGIPSFEGTLEMEYQGNTLYDLYVSGDTVPITVTWTGAEIETDENFSLTLTMPECQLTGESPEVSMDDVPTQPVPFKVLHGSQAAITIDYVSNSATL